MQIKEDWIVKNWDFLKARRLREIPLYRFRTVFKSAEVPTTGKFYGTEQFYEQFEGTYGVITPTGTRRLILRPYIGAPMPEERVKAVFIDPKKYKFDEDGNITGLDGCYESTIIVFTE